MKLPNNFYNELEDAVAKYGEWVTEDRSIDADECMFYAVDLNFDFGDYGCSIEADIEYKAEWEDDSFDHEFGTWEDPAPYYKAVGATIDLVDELHFYDDDGNEVEFDDFNKGNLKDMEFYFG